MTQDQRKQATRRKLLTSATQVFAEKGYSGASIEQISDVAGLSRGAFYAHFEDKNALFHAVLDDMVDQIQQFAADVDSQAGPDVLLRAMTNVNVGHSRVDPTWFQLYSEFRSHALRDPATRTRLAKHYRRLRAVIAKVIDAQFDALQLQPPMSATDLAALVLAVDEGLAIQRGVDPRAIRRELFIEILATLFQASAALARDRTAEPAGNPLS
jgi:AcrR family transcriptional regulator